MNGGRLNWLNNLSLVLVSILITLVGIEWLLWRPNLTLVPPYLQAQLGRIALFAQTSKVASRPRSDYVMLVGDSYAEGLGDWMMQALAQNRSKYNAAHVLHDIVGRDVLSIGMRGGNPLDTYVRRTTEVMIGINQYVDIRLAGPRDLVVFFFEGNDVSDNTALFNFSLSGTYPPTCPLDDSCIDRVIAELSAITVRETERRWHFFRNLSVVDTATKLVKIMAKNFMRGQGIFQSDDPAYYVGNNYKEHWERYDVSPTRVRVGRHSGAYPAETVEPFAFHSADEIEGAANVFGRSLAYIKAYLKPERVFAVYIPSPVIAYHLETPVKIRDRIRFNRTQERPGEPVEFTEDELIVKSQAICTAVEARANLSSAVFVDMRSGLRALTAEKGYAHGPNDPGHFNERGYIALAEALAEALKTGNGVGCGSIIGG